MKGTKLEVQFSHVDSRWSWVVCIASFFLQFLVGGISSSFGVFFIEILNEYKRSEAETAWIGSIAVGITFLCGPFTTSLCHTFGCRIVACTGSFLFIIAALLTSIAPNMTLMYFTFGLLGGFAFSMLYFSSLVVLIEYFSKHLSLANGIAVSGAGAGTLVVSLISEAVCSRYGLRVGFRTLAGMSLIGFLAGLTYVPTNKGQEPLDSIREVTVKSGKRAGITASIKEFMTPGPQWRNKAFVVWTLSLALVLFAYYIPYMYLLLPSKLKERALLVGVLAICQTVGKITFGKLADYPRVNRLQLEQIALLVVAVATCMFPLAKSFGALMTYAVVQGLFDGGFVVLLGLVTHDIVGKDLMAGAVGSMFSVVALPMTAGPPLAGMIYDVLGSYNAVYFLASAMVCVGLCLMFLVPWLIPKDATDDKRVLLSETKDYPINDKSPLDEKKLADFFGGKTSAELLLQRNRQLLDYNLQPNNSRPSSFVLFGIVADDSYRDLSTYTSRADLNDEGEGNFPHWGTPRRRTRYDTESHASTFTLHSPVRTTIPGSCLQVHALEPTIQETAEPCVNQNTTVAVLNEVESLHEERSPKLEIPELDITGMDLAADDEINTLGISDICKDAKRSRNTSVSSSDSNDSFKSSSMESATSRDSGFAEESYGLFADDSADLTASSDNDISPCGFENSKAASINNIDNDDDDDDCDDENCKGHFASKITDSTYIINSPNNEDIVNELSSEIPSTKLEIPDPYLSTNYRTAVQSELEIPYGAESTIMGVHNENTDYYSMILENNLESLLDIASSIYSLNTESDMVQDLGPQRYLNETTV